MKKRSVFKRQSGSVICALFSTMMIYGIIGLPADEACLNACPSIKCPRPCRDVTSDISRADRESDLTEKIEEDSFYPIIHRAAAEHDVDPALVKAIIMAESRYDPMATSKKGAIGLMQIMPRTASSFSAGDMYDPVHNINAGVEYLKNLLNQFEGNLELALAAYNAGPGKVREYQGMPPYEVTILFVKRVFEYYRYYLEA